VRASIPAGPIVVLDAKRGDIGPSAERYAEALMGHLAADAVTLQPYLGEDAIEPFLAYPGRLVYVLARTSNPSAGQLQDRIVDGVPLSTAVARWAADRWPDGRVGLVVGATDPDELARLRAQVPALGFLVPGVGAQGGDLEAAVRHCDGTVAPGLVNVSRGIAEAATGRDWREEAAGAARRWLDDLRRAGATLEANR
jgi:orotidine-5'-phosphate decarboxylase